jgi:hypothetical protein
MNGYDAERLGQLIGMLPPAPESWVGAAQELPSARKGLDQLVARAEADAEFRHVLLSDLEAALEAEGFEPERRVIEEVRRRLTP